MATVKRFEDLVVWQMARVQCNEFNGLKTAGAFRNEIPPRDQMDKSTGSVMDNIGEGFDRFSRADFRKFLVIARGSNAEARSQLYRAFDRDCMPGETYERIKKANIGLGVKLHNFINYLGSSDYKDKPGNEAYRDGPANNNIAEQAASYNYK